MARRVMLVEPGLGTSRRLGTLRPVPRELAARQLPTAAVAAESVSAVA